MTRLRKVCGACARSLRLHIIEPIALTYDKYTLPSDKYVRKYDKHRCHRFLNKVFRNKTVAIVGGSPNLLGRELGVDIERNDLVVRMNLHETGDNAKDYGSRTDFRFIGATMLERHAALVKRISKNVQILTTRKNERFMRAHEVDAFFYPVDMPMQTYKNIRDAIGVDCVVPTADKPPKSGVVLAAMIARYGDARKLTLYGFSETVDEAWSRLEYADGSVGNYDRSHILRNHCDPAIDIELIALLKRYGLVAMA